MNACWPRLFPQYGPIPISPSCTLFLFLFLFLFLVVLQPYTNCRRTSFVCTKYTQYHHYVSTSHASTIFQGTVKKCIRTRTRTQETNMSHAVVSVFPASILPSMHAPSLLTSFFKPLPTTNHPPPTVRRPLLPFFRRIPYAKFIRCTCVRSSPLIPIPIPTQGNIAAALANAGKARKCMRCQTGNPNGVLARNAHTLQHVVQQVPLRTAHRPRASIQRPGQQVGWLADLPSLTM